MKLSDYVTRADQIVQLGRDAAATRGQTSYGGDHLSETHFMEFRAAALSFLINVFGPSHPYYTTFEREAKTPVGYAAEAGIGIMNAVQGELQGGWTQTATGIVSAEIFSDFLEMAEYLLDSGYKDAAAVMIGGVLEEHLRQLCRREGIPLEISGPTRISPKKADQMNADLAARQVYSKLDQKAVTAWLDLRNKAAHAEYAGYSEQQVVLLFGGVQDFMVRHSI